MKNREKKIEQHLSEPLSTRVAKGSLWVFALRLVNRGLAFIRTIILARLLAPSDFGLFGIAMLSLAIVETFSQTGFQAALVQKKGNVEPYLDTAWTVSAVRSTILFCLLFFTAPLIARFFNSPQAALVIRVISVSILLSGFRNVGIVFFQKELEFNKQFLYEFSSALVDLSVAISLAFILRNVWALVWGGLAANSVRLIMSYLIHPFRPKICLEKEKCYELFGFGKWILGSNILIFLITQGDDIFVGKVMGVTSLGLYQMAYMLSNLPATEVTHVVSQVTIPAYSKLQDEIDRLKVALLKTLSFTALLTVPLAGGIFILTPEFIKAFLGDKWVPMTTPMRILCLYGATRSITAAFGPIYRALARVDIPFKINIIQVSILLITIYPLSSYWHISGTAWAITFSLAMTLYLTSRQITKILNIDFIRLYKPFSLPVSATVGMIIVISLLKKLLMKNIDHLALISVAILGVIFYLGLILIFFRIFNDDILYSLKALISSISKDKDMSLSQ